jgi:hypothetical protein
MWVRNPTPPLTLCESVAYRAEQKSSPGATGHFANRRNVSHPCCQCVRELRVGPAPVPQQPTQCDRAREGGAELTWRAACFEEPRR